MRHVLKDYRVFCRPAKEVATIAKTLFNLVSTNTIAAENFLAGMKEILELAPDLHIDIPMLYDYLGKFFAPQIEKKVLKNFCFSL